LAALPDPGQGGLLVLATKPVFREALQVANAELHPIATTGALTGASNRHHFQYLLQVDLASAARGG